MADQSVSIDDTAQTSDVKRMCRREAKLGEAATESPGGRMKTMYECTQGEKVSKEFRLKFGDADHPLASDCRDDGIIIELLRPLCTLPTNKYIEPFLDILQATVELSKHEIFHCHLSPGNLMYRKESGANHGIIIDFDFVVARDTGERNTHDNAGTLPFLPISLLRAPRHNPPPQICRFQLEALTYIFLWDAICSPQGKILKWKPRKFPLKDWLNPSYEINAHTKSNIYSRFNYDARSFPNLGLDYQYLAPCHIMLANLFFRLVDGYLAVDRIKIGRNAVSQEDFNTLCAYFKSEDVIKAFEGIRDVL